MSWQLRFTPLADGDVAETYAWYEAAQSRLGEEFLRDLQRVLDFVVTYPHGCPEVHRGLRRALLHRFPYSVYYRPLDLTEFMRSARVFIKAAIRKTGIGVREV